MNQDNWGTLIVWEDWGGIIAIRSHKFTCCILIVPRCFRSRLPSGLLSIVRSGRSPGSNFQLDLPTSFWRVEDCWTNLDVARPMPLDANRETAHEHSKQETVFLALNDWYFWLLVARMTHLISFFSAVCQYNVCILRGSPRFHHDRFLYVRKRMGLNVTWLCLPFSA